MKTLLICAVLILAGCDKPIIRRTYVGDLTTLRIDDDAEFHFSTDRITENDVYNFQLDIRREDCDRPQLFIYEQLCPDGKTCNEAVSDEWRRDGLQWSVTLPNN